VTKEKMLDAFSMHLHGSLFYSTSYKDQAISSCTPRAATIRNNPQQSATIRNNPHTVLKVFLL